MYAIENYSTGEIVATFESRAIAAASLTIGQRIILLPDERSPHSDMIPLHKVDVECLGLLLEYVQEMADPRVPRSRFLELMVGLPDEWAKHGGDGITNDVLNALYLFEQAEAREAEEAQRRAQDEQDGWDGSHHDRHEEKGEGR